MTAETNTNPPESLPCQIAGIETLLTKYVFAPIDSLGLIRVTGEDRVRWLNGMETNSIQALNPGQGCYTFFLNAQGRIQGDAAVWMLEDSILLEIQRDLIPALIAHLDRFIIMDDVELTDLSGESIGMTIVGPRAAAILIAMGATPSAIAGDGESLTLTHITIAGNHADLIQAHSPLVPRFELWSSPEAIESISESIMRAGIPEAAPEALNQLRILEGTPLYGIDIRDRELPQETAQTRALHFAKGCYLGQEIVERIRSRGNVHRTFSGFTLTGAIPLNGTPLFAENSEKPVGEITSAAEISLPSGAVALALGYIRREVLDRGIQLAYEGGLALPTNLPYKF